MRNVVTHPVRGAALDPTLLGSRSEIVAWLDTVPGRLDIPTARRISSHLRTLDEPLVPVRLAILRTYTSELLDPWLSLESLLRGLDFEVYHAPYGLNLREASEDSGLVRAQPDLTLLLLQRQDVHPKLNEPLSQFPPNEQLDLRKQCVERVCNIVQRFRSSVPGYFVLSILPALIGPGLGIYDSLSDRSESFWWAQFKAEVAQFLRGSVNACAFLDIDEIVAELGRANTFDLRYWYSSRFPFTPEGARELSRRVATVASLLKAPKAKVIAVDADNTLWGGVIGEDGMEGIALGPDYPGSAYVDFQRRLLEYQQRGFILALVSKNNPEDVARVLQDHPHQLLRERHFAASKINWRPKVENLISLSEELNLGLDSFLFFDDSSYECESVRRAVPQVEVVQMPSRPIDIPRCLERIGRLEVLALTDEDRAKTAMYAQDRQRQQLRSEMLGHTGSVRDYLLSLQQNMRVGFDQIRNTPRLAQLTHKTNQFNLTTRRYNEQEIRAFIQSPDWLVAHFSLADVFGDSGITGLALIRRIGTVAEIDTFLMSCRVIGREAESAFLNFLLAHLAQQGVTEVLAQYIPSAKNKLVEHFLPEHGFTQGPDGKYRRDISERPAVHQETYPLTIQVAQSAAE